MRPIGRTRLALALLAGAVLSACSIGSGSVASSPGSGGRLPVVTTTTVFADMVRNVGGDLVNVTSLVPANGDVHTFAPRPSDIRAVAGARLLVMNGLGFDDWLQRTMGNAAQASTPLIKLAEGLSGVQLIGSDRSGSQNPHLWMDVGYGQLYVDRILGGLERADPANGARYRSQAATYRSRLAALDRWVREQVGGVPATNRRIVTFHDAFPYYARAYGITIVGVAVPAPGQDPSAGYTAQLVGAIRQAGVKAIFSERQFPVKLADQLAAETGTRVVANLYDDSLGDPPVTSYEAVIRWDTQQLVEALR
ncbi:MAG: metal ABC transporter substrate-binding protein [Candidatus Limnocylindria bacterium]